MAFSVHSFKVCAHLHAINFNSHASYWCIFCSGVRKSLVKSFKDSLTQQTNLLSYNLKQEFTKEREKTDPPLENVIKTSIEEFSSNRNTAIQEVRVIDPNRRLLATSDQSRQDMVGKTVTDISVQRAIVQKRRIVRMRRMARRAGVSRSWQLRLKGKTEK